MQSPPPPSTIRSGHINIKDAECAKKNDGREISYIGLRLGATGAQTATKKFNFFQK